MDNWSHKPYSHAGPIEVRTLSCSSTFEQKDVLLYDLWYIGTNCNWAFRFRTLYAVPLNPWHQRSVRCPRAILDWLVQAETRNGVFGNFADWEPSPDRARCVDGRSSQQVGVDLVPVEGGERCAEVGIFVVIQQTLQPSLGLSSAPNSQIIWNQSKYPGIKVELCTFHARNKLAMTAAHSKRNS